MGPFRSRELGCQKGKQKDKDEPALVRFKGSELAKGLSDQGEQKGDKNKNEGKHDHAPLNSGAAHEDVQKILSTKESKRIVKAEKNKHVELAKGLSDQGEQKGEKNKNKGKHDHAPAELAKGLSDQGEQNLNSGGAHEVVQKISSTKESKRTVKAEKREQATLSDKNNDPAQKDEPKMVRFKGS